MTEDVAALDLRVRGGLAAADQNLTDVRRALLDLYAVRGWRVLGFGSWPAYLADAGAADVLRPPDAEQRRALVAVMTGEGMTQQAIADELGVSKQQVAKDVFSLTTGSQREHVDPRKARKAELDARIAQHLAEHPEAGARATAKAAGCSQSKVSRWAKENDHKWAHTFGSAEGRALGAKAKAASKPAPPPPSEEPLWTRSTELQDLRGLAVTVRAMKERNARIRIAQNITDAIEAGDQKFVEQHALAAAEVAEYARELLAVFTDEAHRVDLNRGIPGRTDHNYRPALKIATA